MKQLSDDHLINLYQQQCQSNLVISLIQRYQKLINYIEYQVWSKFPNTPLELEDIQVERFLLIQKIIGQYRIASAKQFRIFLGERYRWNLINLLKSYCSNRHKVINWAAPLNQSHYYEPSYETAYTQTLLKADLLKRLPSLLSERECWAVRSRILPDVITDAINVMSKRSCANSLYRAIQKLHAYYT